MSEATLDPSGDGQWALAGVLDFSSVPEVWPALEKQLRTGGALTLSLADVSQANSAGLVLLVEARDFARRADCRLKVVDVPAELLDLAKISGCERLIADNGL